MKEYYDGDVVAAAGKTTTVANTAAMTAYGLSTPVVVTNAGTVKGGAFYVSNLGVLKNLAVDVTMTKNNYQDVTDNSVNSVAGALEAGYTNNSLYQSLNLHSSAELTNAMQQLSGSTAVSAFNEAKVLSSRFTMLADNAVVSPSGLGFNVVAKGDPRSELGNNTQYDMLNNCA